MTPITNSSMNINDNAVKITKIDGEDYICLTDIAKSYGADRVVENWLRNKNTIEFLGAWERFNNSDFNSLEFEGIKNTAGLHRFSISVKEWVLQTNAKGLIAKTGRYGGTYAHKDIAFEFGTWLSPEFKLLIITEFQRLKSKEQQFVEWDSRRYLSRVNYHLHTDSIKEYLLPALDSGALKQFVYTDEADMLNRLVFGQPASEWREANPTLTVGQKNQRDYASTQQLIILANLESLNSHFMAENKSQTDRITLLAREATRQYQSLIDINSLEDDQRKALN